MSRFEAKSPLIAILYDASSDVAPLMRRIVACLTADGLRCAGFVQRDVERPGRSRCDMLLENIATGLRLPISEDRGPGARGCRLDEDALGRAITAAIEAISQAPDVLVLNKFGKSESEGRGFRPLIAAALDAGIPVIVPVPWRNAESWRQFAGELADEHVLGVLAELSDSEICRRMGIVAPQLSLSARSSVLV
jgi:nucleoside-triphosphatase THEP1